MQRSSLFADCRTDPITRSKKKKKSTSTFGRTIRSASKLHSTKFNTLKTDFIRTTPKNHDKTVNDYFFFVNIKFLKTLPFPNICNNF